MALTLKPTQQISRKVAKVTTRKFVRSLACNYCGSTTTSSWEVSDFLNGEYDNVCPICGKSGGIVASQRLLVENSYAYAPTK